MGIPFKSTNHKQLATWPLEIRAYGMGGHRVHTDHNLRIAYHPNDMRCCLTHTQDSKAGQFCYSRCFSVLRHGPEYEISATGHRSPIPRLVVKIIYRKEDPDNRKRNEWCLSVFTCL